MQDETAQQPPVGDHNNDEDSSMTTQHQPIFPIPSEGVDMSDDSSDDEDIAIIVDSSDAPPRTPCPFGDLDLRQMEPEVAGRLQNEQAFTGWSYDDRPRVYSITSDGEDLHRIANNNQGRRLLGGQYQTRRRYPGPKVPTTLRTSVSVDDLESLATESSEDAETSQQGSHRDGIDDHQPSPSLYVPKQGFNWADEDEDEDSLAASEIQAFLLANTSQLTRVASRDNGRQDGQDSSDDGGSGNHVAVAEDSSFDDEEHEQRAEDANVDVEVRQNARGEADVKAVHHAIDFETEALLPAPSTTKSCSHSEAQDSSPADETSPPISPILQNVHPEGEEEETFSTSPVSPDPSDAESVDSTTGMTQAQGMEFVHAYHDDMAKSLVKQRGKLIDKATEAYISEQEYAQRTNSPMPTPPIELNLPETPEHRAERLTAKLHRCRQSFYDLEKYCDNLASEKGDVEQKLEEAEEWIGKQAKIIARLRAQRDALEMEKEGFRRWAEKEHELAELERRRQETPMVEIGSQTELLTPAGRDATDDSIPQTELAESLAKNAELEAENQRLRMLLVEVKQWHEKERGAPTTTPSTKAITPMLTRKRVDSKQSDPPLRFFAPQPPVSEGPSALPSASWSKVDFTSSTTARDTHYPASAGLDHAILANPKVQKRIAEYELEREARRKRDEEMWDLRGRAMYNICGLEKWEWVPEEKRVEFYKKLAAA